MSTPTISIIIPIYNAEAYLSDCLKSILKQTFADYEVWLVNDGSHDKSGEICDTFQTNDTRFHVIHQANGGVSQARNAGLHAAQGQWICFIDSDDTVDPEYLQTLLQAVRNEEKDTLIVQGFKTILPDGKITRRSFPDRLFRAQEIGQTFMELNLHRCGFPFAKLYRRSIVEAHAIRFNEQIHYAEDVMFMLTYLCHVSAIRTVAGEHYNYAIRNNNSLSQRIFPFESEYRCYQTYLSLAEKLQQRFDLSEEEMQRPYGVIGEYLVRRSIGSLYQPQTRKPYAERMERLRAITPEQIRFLNRYYTQCSWFHKVTIALLSKHFYYLCDRFNRCIAFRFALKRFITKYL